MTNTEEKIFEAMKKEVGEYTAEKTLGFIDHPDFDGKKTAFDWCDTRNYIHTALKEIWFDLSRESRMAVLFDAARASNESTADDRSFYDS